MPVNPGTGIQEKRNPGVQETLFPKQTFAVCMLALNWVQLLTDLKKECLAEQWWHKFKANLVCRESSRQAPELHRKKPVGGRGVFKLN